MKATGIIRRVDDLGRVVIPKELRRVFNISEGEPLEIFTSEDGIVFKKYDEVLPIVDYVSRLKTAVTDTEMKSRNAVLAKIKEIQDIIGRDNNGSE